MPLLSKLKNLFSSSSQEPEDFKNSRAFECIKKDQDPEETWKIVGELGDGSFGKVYKVSQFLGYLSYFTLLNITEFTYIS